MSALAKMRLRNPAMHLSKNMIIGLASLLACASLGIGRASLVTQPLAISFERHTMFRKIVAITMFISIVAMSTSGLMMIVIDRTSFTLQMHPVHKVFGLLLVVTAVAHITLNFRSLKAHAKARAAGIAGGLLVAALVGLYAVALSNSVPPDTAAALDALSKKAEQQMEGK
jgi:hypothetical protein